MVINTYKNADDFLNEVQEFLEQDEVENNVILGNCLRLRENKDEYEDI